MEQDLKLKAEDRSAVLQRRADQDAEAIAWVHRERHELLQTTERLHLERSTVHEEHDRAIPERDRAIPERDKERQVVSSLWADLGVIVT